MVTNRLNNNLLKTMGDPKPLVCDQCVQLIGYTAPACIETRVYCIKCGEKAKETAQETRKRKRVAEVLDELGLEQADVVKVTRLL